MTKEQIGRLVGDAKNAVRKEFDDSAQSIRNEIKDLKKSTLDKI